MNTDRSHPPRLAVWLLRRLCPSRNREAITGDLLERLGEGRSGGWFWRQVLVAILVGASLQFRLWTEICVAAAGTALIWCVPWRRVFPIDAMSSGLMSWGERFLWIGAIEITTTLVVLPLFVILFRLRGMFSGANLLRVFFISGMLFAAGDLPAFWWDVRRPISPSQAVWVVPIMLASIFAALLISRG
jgi:hypothetical protein